MAEVLWTCDHQRELLPTAMLFGVFFMVFFFYNPSEINVSL